MKTKTIEDAAKELYPENRPTMFTQFVAGLERAAFKAGVKFAQRWISVEDELPKYQGIDFYVLMKNEKLKSDDINLVLIEGIDDVENVYQYATHWRQIELK